jgi:TPR repeat protein
MFFMWLLILAGLFALLYFSVMPELTERAAVMTYERLSVEESARQANSFTHAAEQSALPSETEARWQLVIRSHVEAVLGRVEARLSEHYILLLVITGITVTLILSLFSFMQATREERAERELRRIRQDILEDWGFVRNELEVIKNEHDKAWRDQDIARQELERIRMTLESSMTEMDRTRRDLDQSKKDLDNSRKSLHSFRREQDMAKDSLLRMKQDLDEHDRRARQELEDLVTQARDAMQSLLSYARSADPEEFRQSPGEETIFQAGQELVQAPVEEGSAIAAGGTEPSQAELLNPAEYRAMEQPVLESRAEAGDSMAVAELGYRYFMGIGVPVDYSVSVEYSRRAAEMGNATAQVDLGFMYMQGLGVPQDNLKAFEYYQKAAEQRHDLGELNLGLLYVRGQGVRQDFVKAFEMFSRAARQGNVLGMLNLGVMHEQGDGVPRNSAKAMELYRMAAERGNVKAMLYLAEIYDQGIGTAADPIQSTYWLTLAANTGNTDAMLKVARRYINGIGAQADSLIAYTYLLLYSFSENAVDNSKVGVLMEKFGAMLTQEQIAAARDEAARLLAGIRGQERQSGGVRG